MFYAFVVLFTTVCVFGVSAQDKNKPVGKWKYEVEQAPYGYNKGTLEIKKQKEALMGELNFSSGNGVKLQKLTMRNDTIWANAYVDSEYIEIVAKISNSKMEGLVDTSMGKMIFKADKVVEVTK